MIKSLTGAQHGVGERGEWEENYVDLVRMAEDVCCSVRKSEASRLLGWSIRAEVKLGWLQVQQREDRKILWGAEMWGRRQTTDDIGSHRKLERAVRHSTSTT